MAQFPHSKKACETVTFAAKTGTQLHMTWNEEIKNKQKTLALYLKLHNHLQTHIQMDKRRELTLAKSKAYL